MNNGEFTSQNLTRFDWQQLNMQVDAQAQRIQALEHEIKAMKEQHKKEIDSLWNAVNSLAAYHN